MSKKVCIPFLLFYFIFFESPGASTKEKSLYKQAERYFFEKKFSLAREKLMNVLISDPNHAKALSLLGDIFLFKKNYERSIEYYQKAIDNTSDPSKEYFRMGQCYLALKNDQKAKKAFEVSYRLDPSMVMVLFQLGYISLVYERDKKSTIEYWKKFLVEAPGDPQYNKIKKVISLLEDPNFKIPPMNSSIPLSEALLLGGSPLEASSSENEDKKAGNINSKESNKIKELLEDEEL